MEYRKVSLLTLGHLFTDINQGAIPALLPFFITEYNLSYAAAGSIVFAANIASSLIQPIFGIMSDRWSKVWLMPLGVLLAGAGVGFAGWVDSFALMLVMVAISGLGVSAFHPEAAKLANRYAKENKATGLSMFAVGGNAGFAFGPLVATGALLLWGPKGTIVFFLLSIATAIILHVYFKDASLPEAGVQHKAAAEKKGEDQWFPFLRLSGVVVARSVLFFGLNTFIPLYWIHVLQETAAVGSSALTVLFSAGIIAVLIGGRLADRYGYRKIMIGGWAMLIPLMYLLTNVKDTFWATVLLLPISVGLFSIYGPIMVTGQAYLPNRVGFASGVTIGLAVSIGGVTAPLLGRLADVAGVEAALQILVIVPVLALVLTYTLPFMDRKATA